MNVLFVTETGDDVHDV